MGLEDEYRFVRHGAALSRMNHVNVARIEGDDALEAVDAVCSGDLWVRDGRMRQTLILDEQARPIADVYVCPDDESCILLFEGITTAELSDCLGRYADPELDAGLVDLRVSHELMSVQGPYAWEVVSKWLTPDIIGLPYLGFYHFDRGTCFRAGKTGEFGYDLLIRKEYTDRAWQDLSSLASEVGGGQVSLQTLDLCALENGFFSVRHGPLRSLTPLELQLQWRVSSRKPFPGRQAIEARRAEGVWMRATYFVASERVDPGDEIQSQGSRVGKVRSAMFSPGIGGLAGVALLDIDVAHPGIDAFVACSPKTSRPIRTVSSPLLFNRSLLVDPHRHTYATRDSSEDPPLFSGTLP